MSMSQIEDVAKRLESRSKDVESWLSSRFPHTEPPIYTSVDIRNAGFKISVVDTNLFPAGFNNLCETFSERGASSFRLFFRKHYPAVQKILIFPEEHTRNLFYWKNVVALRQMLMDAKNGPGLEVEIGSASTHFSSDPFVITFENGETLSVHKVYLQNGFLRTSSFVPDLILINNDLSAGTPEYLKNVNQTLLPSPALGWHQRRKSIHFHHLGSLAQEASEILEIDPWLITPLQEVETGIDLTDEICLKRLKETTDRLIDRIRHKYLKYGISRTPYVFVKNDAGTYGMGVTHVDSGDEFLKLNRKLRNKLQSSKGGQKVNAYLLQEGIPTADLYKGNPLEPVVYLVGAETIGTFFRIHEKKNDKENLNAPGMSFACLCYHKVPPVMSGKTYQLTCENKQHLFAVSSFLGKIASLASVLELKEIRPLSVQSA